MTLQVGDRVRLLPGSFRAAEGEVLAAFPAADMVYVRVWVNGRRTAVVTVRLRQVQLLDEVEPQATVSIEAR